MLCKFVWSSISNDSSIVPDNPFAISRKVARNNINVYHLFIFTAYYRACVSWYVSRF